MDNKRGGGPEAGGWVASEPSAGGGDGGDGASTIMRPGFFPTAGLFCFGLAGPAPSGTSYLGPMYTQMRLGAASGLEWRIHSNGSMC